MVIFKSSNVLFAICINLRSSTDRRISLFVCSESLVAVFLTCVLYRRECDGGDRVRSGCRGHHSGLQGAGQWPHKAPCPCFGKSLSVPPPGVPVLCFADIFFNSTICTLLWLLSQTFSCPWSFFQCMPTSYRITHSLEITTHRLSSTFSHIIKNKAVIVMNP